MRRVKGADRRLGRGLWLVAVEMERSMDNRIRAAAFGTLLAFGAAQPSGADAQLRPQPQTVLSRGAVSTARPKPIGRSVHNVFGSIVSIAGPKFFLRTRFGRVIVVDATTAMQQGSYSAPLFVGKVVLVGGAYDAARVLHATTVTRMTRIDATTPRDT
jgi:hypothetical protein